MPKSKGIGAPATKGNAAASILPSLQRIVSEGFSVELSEKEKAQFQKARLAAQEAQRNNFVLGGQVAYNG